MAVEVDVPGIGTLCATGLPSANKKRSRQQAAQAMLLAEEFAAALPQPALPAPAMVPILVPTTAPPGENFISRLNELGQVWRVDRPHFEEVERGGPLHTPFFRVRVSLCRPGGPEAGQVSAIGLPGQSLALAKHAAAQMLLSQLHAEQEAAAAVMPAV